VVIEIADASIYYESRGSGHPLILISGFTCDYTVWNPLIDSLASRFQVIRFDNRGVGRTKDSGQLLSADLLAEDVRGLIQALRLKKPHVIGQSMGGSIAQRLAARYPEEIGKLGLLVTSAKWRQTMLLALRAHLELRKSGTDPSLLFDMIVPWICGEEFLQHPSRLRSLKNFELDDSNPQSIEDQERQFAILESFDGREDLQKIQSPTLVLYGEEDLMAPPSDAFFLQKQIPDAKIEGFKAGHGVILEQSRELSYAISTFFGLV
jgi:pimeloyl-ACP methyl ester carboxylesterase